MFVEVNGARLYFDVENPGLVPDGTVMRSKPTLVLLHGGPGADHSFFKVAFPALADLVQIVYYDHRGSGRSGGDDPATWNLAQWADDLKGLCDTLGIVKPIIYGVSFGGFVAQAYATRYPDHLSKLVLTSTAAHVDFQAIFDAFGEIGGELAREVAQTYWMAPTPERRARYFEVCLPFYAAKSVTGPSWFQHTIIRNEVAMHFNGPKNEHGRFDFRESLSRITCPVLVMAGDRDPITPIAFSEEIVAHLPPHLVRFERFEGCGHGVAGDEPERAFQLLREFIASEA